VAFVFLPLVFFVVLFFTTKDTRGGNTKTTMNELSTARGFNIINAFVKKFQVIAI